MSFAARDAVESTANIEYGVIHTMILKQRLSARVKSLIDLGLSIQQLARDGKKDAGMNTEFFTSGDAFIERTFPDGHAVRLRWEYLQKFSQGVEAGVGVLKAAQTEIDGDWLPTLSGLVAGEVFDNFLDMASHLISEGYKDAAAVIAGSSLEAHLRRMAALAGIPIETTDAGGKTKPKRAEALNEDLMKAGVYHKAELKQVTAWLGIRNHAAHGEYDKVQKEFVALMISGVRTFTNAHPA
jgi:hypothetical protein